MMGHSRHKCDIGVADNFVETIEGIGALYKIQNKTITKVTTIQNSKGRDYGLRLEFEDGSTFNLLSHENREYRDLTELSFEFTEDIG